MRLGESRRVFIQGRSVGRGAAYLGRTAPENVYEARLNPPPLTSRFPPSCPSSPPHNALLAQNFKYLPDLPWNMCSPAIFFV